MSGPPADRAAGPDPAGDDPHRSPFVARVYDAEHAADAADTTWALRLAGQPGGRVADLGCGTGRLALPLARAGCRVLAVDHSAAMLGRLRRRLAEQPAQVRERVRPEEADLRSWRAEAGSLDAAIMGYNTFAALLTAEEQRAFLAAAAAALRPGGLLALATAALSAPHLALPEGVEREVYRRPAPELGPGVELRRRDVHRWTDQTLQLRRLALIYDIVEPDGGRRREQFEYAARYTTRWELEHLLARCGFGQVRAEGGYTGEPFRVEGGLLVVTARRDLSP